MFDKIRLGIYANKKGKLCELFDVAIHSKNGEKLAIYRHIDENKKINKELVYAVSLKDFINIEGFKFLCCIEKWEEYLMEISK